MGNAAIFELCEDDPLAFRLKLSTMAAAKYSEAELIAVERFGPMLRLTFDRNISQSLVVHILTLLIEGDVNKVDIPRNQSSFVGGD